MKRPDSLEASYRLATLIKFAETRGRNWRRKLQDYWSTGVTSGWLDSDEAAHLQAIRNDVGPVELGNISLPLMEEWQEDDLYREAASEMYENDGSIEIDGSANISRGDDDGAYVQAWVWVPSSRLAVGEDQ